MITNLSLLKAFVKESVQRDVSGTERIFSGLKMDGFHTLTSVQNLSLLEMRLAVSYDMQYEEFMPRFRAAIKEYKEFAKKYHRQVSPSINGIPDLSLIEISVILEDYMGLKPIEKER